MSLFDILRRPDVTLYYYVRLQSLAGIWTPVGETRDFLGETVHPILSGRTVKFSYGTLTPFQGLAETGHCNLDLVDCAGYLAGLLAGGTATALTADVETADDHLHVVDTSAFPAAGELHLHRECVSYTSKTATTFDDLTRQLHDDYGYLRAHRLGLNPGPVPTGASATVRVATSPLCLEGRWLSVNVICLDPGGFPIYDAAGAFHWEVWRGVVTALPLSPDLVSYRLQAETFERLIQSTPPTSGFYGSLLTGAWQGQFGSGGALPWEGGSSPLFIPSCRSRVRFSLSITAADYTGPEYWDIEVGGGWHTFGSIAKAIQDVMRATYFPDVQVSLIWSPLGQTDKSGQWSGEPALYLQVSWANWPYLDADITMRLTLASDSPWTQLGFVDPEGVDLHITNGETPPPMEFSSAQFPALVLVLPTDDELPCLSTSPTTPAEGWVDVDGEGIYYASYVCTQYVDGIPCYVLQGCRRGYGGTVAKQWLYRLGDQAAATLPKIEPLACVGGGAVKGGNSPDPSVWTSLRKLLTGTNGEGANGTYPTWPGLGISHHHLDEAAMTVIEAAMPYAGCLAGRLTDVRQFLSDALALEGFGLVTRPAPDGSGVKLCPVRAGACGLGETALTLALDATEGVAVRGGLGDIINQVRIEAAESRVNFFDVPSQDTFGVQQQRSYALPLSDAVGLLNYAGAAARIFALAGGRNCFVAEGAITAPGRALAPGDVASLTFPNPALTGLWRVLEAETTLRGQGSIRIRALHIAAWDNLLYAPTSAVDHLVGLALTIAAGDGQWFTALQHVWIHDPDDYSDGIEHVITALSGDVLTLDDVTGVTPGDIVELLDHTDAHDARFAYLVTAHGQWGD
jgi:hypothetical protein